MAVGAKSPWSFSSASRLLVSVVRDVFVTLTEMVGAMSSMPCLSSTSRLWPVVVVDRDEQVRVVDRNTFDAHIRGPHRAGCSALNNDEFIANFVVVPTLVVAAHDHLATVAYDERNVDQFGAVVLIPL